MRQAVLLLWGLGLLGCSGSAPRTLGPWEAERLLLRAELTVSECLRLIEDRLPELRGRLRLPPDWSPQLPTTRLVLAVLGAQAIERLRIPISERALPEPLDVPAEHPHRKAVLLTLRAGLLEFFPNQTFRAGLAVDGYELERFLERLMRLRGR